MKCSEEEEREGEGGVEEGDVVPRPGEQQPRHQAHDHAHVLVHRERKEIPLGQRRGYRHQRCGQINYLRVKMHS